VPGVDVYLGPGGGSRAETITGPDGCYEFTDVEGGEGLAIAPWKDDDVPLFTVMGWDAALCWRAALGMELYPPVPGVKGAETVGLTMAESLSCDLDRNGIITVKDALNIGNKAAGVQWWASRPQPSEWLFDPSYRDIPFLDDDLTDQNFSAVLLGDVDGNWFSLGTPVKGGEHEAGTVTASYNPADYTLEVFIRVRPTPGIVSMDCAVSYNPNVLEFIGGDIGSAFNGFSQVGNDNGLGLSYGCAFRPDPADIVGTGPTIRYRVKDVEALRNGDGLMTLEGFYLNDQQMEIGPIGGGLLPPAPNPFNPETSIEFYLPEGTPRQASLKVYNLQGQLVRTLVDDVLEAGQHVSRWDGKNEAGVEVASGVFFAILDSGDIHETRKLMLLK